MATDTLTAEAHASTANAIDQAVNAGTGPLEYLRQRGYVQDVSDADGLAAAFAGGPITAYIGFDPSATSLHVGNLVGIMMLGVLQRFGHRPIALGGGGTALVGDPSGKTSARALISPEDIDRNLAGVLPQFARYLDFDGGRFGNNPSALLINNADWLLGLRYIEFLRDIGRHFSVNEMLAAETYKNRLETTGLNFVEFNYRLVQAYDFLHLYRTESCILQMGGSDQWGNILAGVDLIRKVESEKAFALVSPLITTASGQKMGKTEGNATWLDPERTSPYDYYQFWVNVEDADVARFLRLFTFLPDAVIDDLTSMLGAALRAAKQTLAFHATALTHGEAAATEARQAAASLFGGRASASDASVPTTEIDTADIGTGIASLADLFVRAGLARSRGEARRLAAQGGLSLDDQRVDDVDRPFRPASDTVMLRAGKKRYRRIIIA